jgi:uncharacterized membrane protein
MKKVKWGFVSMGTIFLKEKLYNFLSKRLSIALVILLSVIYFSSIIIEHKDYFTSVNQAKDLVIDHEKTDEIIGEIKDGMTIVQTFNVDDHNNLQIALPFGTFNRTNSGQLFIDIIDNSQVIDHQVVEASVLPDAQDIYLEIPNDEQKKHRNLELIITSKGLFEGNSVTLWKSNDTSGQLIIDNQVQQGSLYFKVTGDSVKAKLSEGEFYLLFIAFLTLFIVAIIFVFKFKNNIPKLFVVLSLSLGIIMVFIFPPFDHLDELEHYYRAYEVSEGKMINQVVDGQLGNYIPTSLINTVNKVRYIHQKGYEYKIVDEAFSMKLNPDDRTFYRNYASIYSPILYIPQALGIIISRIFNAAPITMLYLGRLFNFLAYVSLIYYSLKILPFKKHLMLIIALLPMTLIQASSLSADALVISFSFLFVSTVLRIGYGKEVTTVSGKNIFLLIVVGMFMSISKPVYVPLLLLVFIIPYHKFGTKKIYFRKVFSILVCCVLPMIIWNMLNLTNISVPDVRGGEGISPSDQVHFVLTHPFRYIKVIYDTILNYGSLQFLAMLGKAVTNYGYSLSPIIVFGFVFLLFFASIPNRSYLEEEAVRLQLIKKALLVLIISTVLVLTYTALYTGFTSVGGSLINGIQGRYFLPIAPLFFLMISSDAVVIKDKKVDMYMIISLCILLFSLLLNYILKINGAMPF